MRSIKITKDFNIWALGSVLIEIGNTKVICNVSASDKVPFHAMERDMGWLTAEYSMLPAATSTRNNREVKRGKISGRTAEIQRLIGRSLRAVVDLKALKDVSITVDCDVIQADGGTRTTSITGACIALQIAFNKLLAQGVILTNPMQELVAAISVGIVEGKYICDLDYRNDSHADVDMNIVMTESGNLVEIQGTAEGQTFSHDDLNELVELAQVNVRKLISIQKEVLSVS